MKSSNLMDGWVGLFTKDVQTWGFVKFGWNLTKDGQNGANVKEDCLEFQFFTNLLYKGAQKTPRNLCLSLLNFLIPQTRDFPSSPATSDNPQSIFKAINLKTTVIIFFAQFWRYFLAKNCCFSRIFVTKNVLFWYISEKKYYFYN